MKDGASEDDTFPLTEPVIIPCLYLTGLAFEVSKNIVRIVGWVTIPDLGGETAERRVQVRFALPKVAARQFRADLSKSV